MTIYQLNSASLESDISTHGHYAGGSGLDEDKSLASGKITATTYSGSFSTTEGYLDDQRDDDDVASGIDNWHGRHCDEDWAESSVGSQTFGSKTLNTLQGEYFTETHEDVPDPYDNDSLQYSEYPVEDEARDYVGSFAQRNSEEIYPSSAYQDHRRQYEEPEATTSYVSGRLTATSTEQSSRGDASKSTNPVNNLSSNHRKLAAPSSVRGRHEHEELEEIHPSLPSSPAHSGGVLSPGTTGSRSSWEDATRNMSLLDSEDEDDEEENQYEEVNLDQDAESIHGDDDTSYASESEVSASDDNDSDMDVRETMREVFKGMKRGDCNYSATQNSFDDETYTEFQFLPKVLQKFNRPMSNRAKRSSDRRRSRDPRIKSTPSSNSEFLFEKVSALGEEFMQMQLHKKNRDLRRSSYRRDSDRRRSGRGRDRETRTVIESFVSANQNECTSS